MDVALATCLELPEPDFDQQPLVAALTAAGLEARPLAWDDPAADFASARMTLLRSTWNYPLAVQRFRAWVESTQRCSILVNDAAVVRWNLHKAYLLDLAAAGVPVVPTELVCGGSTERLQAVLGRHDWSDVVVKPAISAGSYRTLRVGPSDIEAGEEHLSHLLAWGDALVQPYVPSVEDHGERAIVVIEGEVSHAVRKSPRFAGEHESVSGVVPVSRSEAAVAAAALAAATRYTGRPTPPLYARIDLAPDGNGNPLVMELELIEPSLFFAAYPPSLERLVAGVLRRLAS